ncbi:immunity protein Imm33 domain-containing protein [Delftia acidovorans]|uniref:immunity protein Imm33 domain-containing protein n=1 Tax=Delftia acidovorans TaxID=80866 RepID=UPI0005567F96|nr:hypothetical protein [Delftia acidovorans]ATH14564.1 hypothetical protein CHL79_20080 [Delftia acidovorans]QQB51982.1 hypothetical protein I6H54_06890 [Delftia acidovorans]
MLQKHAAIGDEVVTVACADSMAVHAEWLLDCLTRLHGSGQSVGEEVRLQVGSMLMSFRRLPSNELAVCVPDVDADPFKDETTDVSNALQVLFNQISFAKKIDVEPVPTTFQDKVVIDQGCLSADNLFMVRSAPSPTDGDSGWFIGQQGPRELAPALEAVFAFQLLKMRPELAAALVLPEGFLVMVDAAGISVVTDPGDQTLFTSNDR